MHAAEDKDTATIVGIPMIRGFDRSVRTVTWVKLSILIAFLAAVACLATGIYAHVTGIGNLILVLPSTEFVREAILLAVSLVLTFTNDALGYVHSVSLRWALYRENRLAFNTNFRLFTSARTSFANRWYMNIWATAMLTLSYACASLLLVRTRKVGVDDFTQPDREGRVGVEAMGVNGMALMLLGFSLLGQIFSAMLCLRNHDTQIPTWSASPLANTLTGLYGHSGLQHQPGRCMMSVAEKDMASGSRKPTVKQPALWSMRFTKLIVVSLWVLCLASFGWAVAMIRVTTEQQGIPMTDFRFTWAAGDLTNPDEGTIMFNMNPEINVPSSKVAFPPAVQILMSILFLSLVQGVQALGLHCVELLVNVSRDEFLWQRASHERGALIGSEPLFAALKSWRTIVLTILKTLLHWLLGQGLIPYSSLFLTPDIWGEIGSDLHGGFLFLISPSRLLVFAAVSGLTAIYTTVLALWQIRSPQPAAWGHLQTLANLVDDWRTIDGRLWWGDKSDGETDVRHAGTAHAAECVGKLDMDALYAASATVLGEHRIRPRVNWRNRDG